MAKEPKETRESADGTRLWLLMMKAHDALKNYAAPTMRAEGLLSSEFRILEALLHKGAMPVNVLGVKVALTTGSISTAIERLHNRGLVTRADSKDDRRQRFVDLTPRGRKLIERVFAMHSASLNKLAADVLDGGDRRRMAAALKALGQAAARTQS